MIRVRQIKVNVEEDSFDALKKNIASKLNVSFSSIEKVDIVKKSIDARDKERILFVYEVDVSLPHENLVLKKMHSKDVFLSVKEEYQFPSCGSEELSSRPIIVGSGPAGLFCAYMLASKGYQPLVIERGEKVEKRIETVEEFFKTGTLNENSNIQFGEGGAGTFSDGKLNTLVKDKRHLGKKVFEIFVECGASEEILYWNHPHIGTDKLREVIPNLRKKIISMDGEFLFETQMTDVVVEDGKLKEIEVNHQRRIPCEILVLAIGHSARDTLFMLYEKGLFMESKPFAVGVRIEHPQKMIQTSQYGKWGHLLPPSEYKLTYTTKSGRGVYSFCMCPGGYVVNASSEKNRLVVNGMSEQKRDSFNANSALVVTVNSKDYGTGPLDGIWFQRAMEEKAYQACNGKIPVQLYKDFLEKKKSVSFGSFSSVTKGEVSFSDLNTILPTFLSEALKEAMVHFGKRISGFDRDDAILLGVETRTSSPVRILRDEHFISSVAGIYPCGEGAGYAGGITTSAMDGIKCAEEIMKKYQQRKTLD